MNGLLANLVRRTSGRTFPGSHPAIESTFIHGQSAAEEEDHYERDDEMGGGASAWISVTVV
jgi:hypothetical protein